MEISNIKYISERQRLPSGFFSTFVCQDTDDATSAQLQNHWKKKKKKRLTLQLNNCEVTTTKQDGRKLSTEHVKSNGLDWNALSKPLTGWCKHKEESGGKGNQ